MPSWFSNWTNEHIVNLLACMSLHPCLQTCSKACDHGGFLNGDKTILCTFHIKQFRELKFMKQHSSFPHTCVAEIDDWQLPTAHERRRFEFPLRSSGPQLKHRTAQCVHSALQVGFVCSLHERRQWRHSNSRGPLLQTLATAMALMSYVAGWLTRFAPRSRQPAQNSMHTLHVNWQNRLQT